jgi:RHS repeat-associated protein
MSKYHVETGEAITFAYDSIGRLHTRSGPEGTSIAEYDTATNGIGKVASLTSPDGVKTSYSYDVAGRNSVTTETINDASYMATSIYYDGTNGGTSGLLKERRLPSIDGINPGLTLTYKYNTYDYLAEIDYSAVNVPQTLLWKALSRNADGNLVQEEQGTADIVTMTYDQYLGRLSRIEAEGIYDLYGPTPAVALFNISYDYYKDGLVKTRRDYCADLTCNAILPRRVETFTYDTLARLWKWNTKFDAIAPNPTVRNVQYDYDDEGKLFDVKVGVNGGALSIVEKNGYTGTAPHAVSSHQVAGGLTAAISVDKHGRQTTEGAARAVMSYSDLDLPKNVKSGKLGWSIGYDAFGQRTRKCSSLNNSCADAASDWIYTGEGYERRTNISGGIPTVTHVFHVSGPDGPIADLSTTSSTSPVTVDYVLTDALGSISALVKPSGSVHDRRFYEPFGQHINTDGTAATVSLGPWKEGFTGQEHDEELGWINYKRRMYDPWLRNLLTPDPMVPHPDSAQSWNRYSYVDNNPLNRTDPSGFQDQDIGEEGGSPSNENVQQSLLDYYTADQFVSDPAMEDLFFSWWSAMLGGWGAIPDTAAQALGEQLHQAGLVDESGENPQGPPPGSQGGAALTDAEKPGSGMNFVCAGFFCGSTAEFVNKEFIQPTLYFLNHPEDILIMAVLGNVAPTTIPALKGLGELEETGVSTRAKSPIYPTANFPPEKKLGLEPGEKGFFGTSGSVYGVRVGNATAPRGGYLMFESSDLNAVIDFAESVSEMDPNLLREDLAILPEFGNRMETIWVIEKPATFTITGRIGPQGTLPGGNIQFTIPRTEVRPLFAFPFRSP